MTTKDLKAEIQKALEQVPENTLTEVLAYLQEIQNRPPGSINNPVHLAKILAEDNEVLKKACAMILVPEALQIHDALIEKFGGGKGIRDEGALQAALNRPFATFGELDLYPNAVHKAAALIESLLINHPFIDGNKRTGYVLMRLLLLQAGADIRATQEEKYDFVISISKGELRFDGIVKWLEENGQG